MFQYNQMKPPPVWVSLSSNVNPACCLLCCLLQAWNSYPMKTRVANFALRGWEALIAYSCFIVWTCPAAVWYHMEWTRALDLRSMEHIWDDALLCLGFMRVASCVLLCERVSLASILKEDNLVWPTIAIRVINGKTVIDNVWMCT